ncbi:hypothetical protein K7432_008517 [Basidiobolus ranarum]|uniref:Yeast cell wall synthesis Kre9/Knh1-like N-terminal domain-containing protein n=1 Tax=Basidiobolus ranarum TaxID=34480 RepID=A0ABR2VYF9_9FUNG
MLRLTTHLLIIVALLGHAVVDATLAFTSPLGVEWKVGSQNLITWMDNGDGKPMPATFDLSLLSGQSSALQLIANVASNVNSASGVYQWTIPNDINPGKYVLRAGGGDGTYSPYFDIIGADPIIPPVAPTASNNATTSISPVTSQKSTNTSTSQSIPTSDSKSSPATSSVGAIVGTSETPTSIISSSVLVSSTVEPSSSTETVSSNVSSTTVVTPITSSHIPSLTTSNPYQTPTPLATSSGNVKNIPNIVMIMVTVMGMGTFMGSYGGVF